MNILIVDDQVLFLNALLALLKPEFPEANFSVADSGTKAIETLKHQKPDLVLLDVNMHGMNGLEVAEHIRKKYPRVKIIMVTNISGKAMVLSLVKIAHGFLFKHSDVTEMKKVILGVMEGKSTFCSTSSDLILDNASTMDNLSRVHLDEFEMKMIVMLADGKTSKEMAQDLGKTEKALNRHREELLKKTKTKNTPELIAYAFRNGLIL